MKINRKIIEIDDELCDGCGQCVPSCAEGALQVIDGKARIVADKFCDGLGACMGTCPQGALKVIEREAEDFDEEAVAAYLQEKQPIGKEAGMACGCPSENIQIFDRPAAEPIHIHGRQSGGPVSSALSHWPVQIRLVPPMALFLKNADLLVVADCVPLAYPDLHADFIAGRVVMMGCPKFDDSERYVDKFCQIFEQAAIKSVTVVVMEVPCCSGMPSIVQKGIDRSGVDVPFEIVVIGTRGEVLERKRIAGRS